MRPGVRLCLAALVAAAPAASDREPGGYALRLAITPAPGGGTQRVVLPASVLVALRNRDGTDVRVFDGRGRAVPIARAAPPAPIRRDRLLASPILGAPDLPAGARVSVRFDKEGRARLTEVNGASGPATASTVLGALLDARAIRGAVDRLTLEADLPAGQPVRVVVEASRDLDDWRPIGERVFYQPPGSAKVDGAVALHGARLDHDYLRVSWSAGTRLLTPVSVRSAVVASQGESAAVVADAVLPRSADDHAVSFVAPIAIVSSLRIVPVAADGTVPVTVLGRDLAEEPWVVLGQGLAAADARPIALGASPRTLRIEADRRTAGFSTAPGVRLGFQPQAIAFSAAAQSPLVLAAGRAGASDPFLPLAMLPGSGADLSEAQVASGPSAPVVLAAPDETTDARRRGYLWATLLGAVGLLGALAWFTWRKGAAAPRIEADPV